MRAPGNYKTNVVYISQNREWKQNPIRDHPKDLVQLLKFRLWEIAVIYLSSREEERKKKTNITGYQFRTYPV